MGRSSDFAAAADASFACNYSATGLMIMKGAAAAADIDDGFHYHHLSITDLAAVAATAVK